MKKLGLKTSSKSMKVYMEIAERLVTDDCWAFEIGDRSFTEDNFSKDRFEKAWIAEHGSQQ